MRYLKHCLQALLTLSYQVLTRFFALFFLIHFPHYLAAWNRLGSLLHTVQRHYDVFHKNEKKLPKKTADISRRHHWFSPKNNWKKKKKKNSCGVTKCRLLSQARRKAIFDLPRPLPRELFGIGPLRIIPNPLIRRAGLFPRGTWSGGGITHQVT